MEEAPPQKPSADAAGRIREEAGMSEADSPEEDDGRDAAPGPMPEDEVRRLEACVREILSALLRPLCAGVRLDVDMTARPVAVRIEADDAEVLMSFFHLGHFLPPWAFREHTRRELQTYYT